MKKLFAFCLAFLMLFSAALAEPIAGGWTMIESLEGTNEEAMNAGFEAFEKAKAALVGVDLTYVQTLATQVVAGTNYCTLAMLTPVTADGEGAAKWVLVTVYEDLEGNSSIIDITEVGQTLAEEGMAGGWRMVDEVSAETMDVVWTAFDAFAEENGCTVYAYMFLNTQVVAGANYEVLCCYAMPVEIEKTEDTDEKADELETVELTEAGLALATVYVDLEGNASVTEFMPLQPGIQE